MWCVDYITSWGISYTRWASVSTQTDAIYMSFVDNFKTSYEMLIIL